MSPVPRGRPRPLAASACLVIAVSTLLSFLWLQAARSTVTGIRLAASPSVSATPATTAPVPAARPRIPRHLVHHNFRKATPTHWCANHRVVCVHELTRRIHGYLARHPHHRTHWGSLTNRRAWHHRYVRAWRARYSTGCDICKSGPKRRHLTSDWQRFRSGVSGGEACDIGWERTTKPSQFPDDPFYSFDCQRVLPDSHRLGTPGKVWILCQATALTITGVGAAGTVMTGGALMPVAVSGVAETAGCATGWSLMHFLNWP